jgi:FkbM family methyltransferase
MFIPLSYLVEKYSLKTTGVLHIGAHEAEENPAYLAAGIPQTSIYWIDAIPDLCTRLRNRGIPNVINAAVSDKVETVTFHITDNIQSSSILPLKEHLRIYPGVRVIKKVQTQTRTLDSIVNEHKITANFLNMDIQGAELKCLKGFESNLAMIDYIYAEVNEKELYEGCALLSEFDGWLTGHGFVRKEIHIIEGGWGDAFYVRDTLTLSDR